MTVFIFFHAWPGVNHIIYWLTLVSHCTRKQGVAGAEQKRCRDRFGAESIFAALNLN